MCDQVKQRMQILWSQSLCAAHIKRQKFFKWKRRKSRRNHVGCCCFCCHLALNAIIFVFMNCEIECEMPVFLHSLVICTTVDEESTGRKKEKNHSTHELTEISHFSSFSSYAFQFFRAHFKRIIIMILPFKSLFSSFFFQNRRTFHCNFFLLFQKEKLLYCET